MIRKSLFVKVAKKLIGPSGLFADFLQDCVITKTGNFDYTLQRAPKQTQSIKMVNIKEVEELKTQIKENCDIVLIGIFEELNFAPSVDDTTFSFEGIVYHFKYIEIDPAKATITLYGNR